jgi:hypothetical protein
MSSADWMERNLDWRVEVAFPILDPELRRHVAELMSLQVRDTCKARILDARQSNQYVGANADGFRSQLGTYQYFQALAQANQDGAPVQTLQNLNGLPLELPPAVNEPSVEVAPRLRATARGNGKAAVRTRAKKRAKAKKHAKRP